MLYTSNATLPISVRQQLPPRAQDFYREAFNETWALHAGDVGREEHASRVAWAAVKQLYHLVPGGQWHPIPSPAAPAQAEGSL
ncbi:MAG: cation transporter [Reyranella sp.]|uniref:ChaB family protein n=1 Tax=Reyranella sp. TaxID=1929291 RepID=UPI00121F42D3|nr:ChaB family protein [Reyranella sp.]TAJ96930.1 MAG: cation transporter [Reyranella sp.]TBR24146.1 MAG: cation transporter [Reyranella sp.]